ncbi:ABC transporter ATP-binding protein/permease [Candidatus Pantoea multigeneris]|uniref:ATP-binding cassette domain-containing protein n=1 Tax=Candidatus Pantoea multigeneris TaxID=2608357 RepID=A0ABX0R8H6_9GAMM|nr:ATP-binding cassette domain-containing protein [Pantoea multigeneris]NIF21636.1 ATP-binding cassette domain-containing protein [Pantoea multigeneris]
MRKAQFIGLALFLLVALITLVGPLLAAYAPDEIRDMPFASPGKADWAGTDYLGADILSRVLSGGQRLLSLACLSVVLAWFIGGVAGMLAALQGRWLDRLLLMMADVLLSIPGLLLLTLVVTVGGRGYPAAVIATILVMLPDIFRLVRAATLQQLQQDYINVARCRGESVGSLLCREIAPNLLPLFSADLGIRLLGAMFILATASFLGLAAQSPQADWGLMIMENRQGLTFQPWGTLAPVIAILLLLIPLNLTLDRLFIPARRPKKTALQPAPGQRCADDCVLELQQFSLRIREKTLLHPLSLQLKPGEIVALVGTSGSGKSTLLRAALGHYPDTTTGISGEVWLARQSLSALNDRRLRRLRAQHVGFVPQDPRLSLLPSQTLGAYLRLIAAGRGIPVIERDRQIACHFQQLGLPDDAAFLRRYPHQVSGGQRQRVMVVAAMLGYPALVLMDEPTSALDGISTQSLMRWVAATAREHKMSVLFVAHDLPQASQIADKILVMAQGQLVEQQPTPAFLHQPLSRAGQRLLGAWQLCTSAQQVEQEPSIIMHADKLSARYGGRTVVTPVQFSLRRGATLTIAGPSGSGKTTLLRTLAGLHVDAEGMLHLQGERLPLPLHQRSRLHKKQLQYVAQNPASSLNPFYRVRSLLQRPLYFCQPNLNRLQRERRMLEVLQQVGLEGQVLDCKASTLSGGQQQRVALARALIARPDILLCDEVTSAVDGPTRMALLQLLQRLQREQGITLLMVTHDLMLPTQLGGQLMVIDQGQVVEQGRTVDLLANPAHPITRKLVDTARVTASL